MNKVTTIYALLHPVTNEIRYVGKTVNTKRRFSNHCTDSLKEQNYKANWIKSILPLKPYFVELEIVNNNGIEAERFWITYFKSLGARLTNLTNGGEGCFGYKHTMKSREIMSLKAKGRISPLLGIKRPYEDVIKIKEAVKLAMNKPEIKQKLRILKTGIKDTEETKIKKSKALKEFWNTEEGKLKKTASFTEESKSKMSKAHKGKQVVHSEETKLKLSESLKGNKNALGFKQTEEARLKISLAAKEQHRKRREANKTVKEI